MKNRKWLKWLFLPVITLLLFVFSLELIYRNYWFDFYKAELKNLNSKEILNSNKNKVLICGDSFSASPTSYVQVLRDSLSNYDIVNASVPGSGILQHSLYMKKRIKKFMPKVFIYQFYVGNDLFDISHPVQSDQISFSRKIYWWISDRIWSIAYLNFRSAGIRYNYFNHELVESSYNKNEIFSADSYSKREILNYKAEPDLIENTLYLTSGRKQNMDIFKRKLQCLKKFLDSDCKKYFLIIPHESMVSEQGFLKHQILGAQFYHQVYKTSTVDFPLYHELYKICNELGFNVVDPLDELRLTETSCYYTNDPHFNLYGHYITGNYLLNKITFKQAL